MNPEMRSGKRTIPWSTSYPPLWQSQGRTRIHEERHSQLWLFCTSWAPMVIVSIAPCFFKLHSVLSNCKSMVFVTYEFLFHSFLYFLFIHRKIMPIIWHRNAFYPDSIELHRMLSDIPIAIYELKGCVPSSHFHFRFAFT